MDKWLRRQSSDQGCRVAEYRIKNWERFQHYKDRKPPWIKLHRSFHDDYASMSLALPEQALLMHMWIFASESNNGEILLTNDEIAWKLHISITEFEQLLKPLISRGFIQPCKQRASKPLASPSMKPLRGTEDTEVQKKQNPARARRAPTIDRPEEVPEQVWMDFLAHRRAKKAPLTATALKGIEREVSKAPGVTLAEALEIICQRGWTGFKAEWIADGKVGCVPNSRRTSALEDAERKVIENEQKRHAETGGNRRQSLPAGSA